MTSGAPEPEGPPDDAPRGDGRRIVLGLGLVAVGFPLASAGTFPLLLGILGTTDNAGWDLALIGLAALVPGVVLVAIGIWVLARAPRAQGPDGPPRPGG